MRVTILGKRWTLKFVRLLKNWGDCDPPHTPHKVIRIDTQHETVEELADTVIHECTHCAFPDVKEEIVARFATDLTRILNKLELLRNACQDAQQKNSHQKTG